MTFAISKYICPIERSLLLSSSLNYSLDNPRTEEEIKIVKNFITESLEGEEGHSSLVAPIGIRLILSLKEINEPSELINNNEFALKYYKSCEQKRFIDILAETWIIVRFPEEDEFNTIANNKDELFRTIVGNENTVYATRFNELAAYCHALSALINTDDGEYYGESFLLSNHAYDVFLSRNNYEIKESIENFIRGNFSFNNVRAQGNWKYWLDVREWIFEDAERLESLIIKDKIQERGKKIRLSQNQTPKEKIFHIGGLQKTAYEHLKDPELMLLLLVSIIEYLVTRNPDTSKFNVEDSISKQFKLKSAVLIHNQDDEYDMVQLNAELSNLYSQRSDIAHGNYKDDFSKHKVVESVKLLNVFIKHMINEFIDDKELLEYLKEN